MSLHSGNTDWRRTRHACNRHPYLRLSNRNPLHNISRYPLLPPVVKPGRSRLRVPGQILNIFDATPCVKRSVMAVTRKEC